MKNNKQAAHLKKTEIKYNIYKKKIKNCEKKKRKKKQFKYMFFNLVYLNAQ